MQFERLQIPDVLLLLPAKHGDKRGFFSETYRADRLAAQDMNTTFVQDNHVYSAQKGVLRGLHFQLRPRAQGKLVRCIRGSIFDVAVDIRVGSPTYGQHVGRVLSASNWHQLWVPPGFAHGYVTLENECEVIYKVTDYYAPECDRGIAWDDPALGIDWPLPRSEMTLSEKDSKQPLLAEIPTAFRYVEQGS
jgi:dTDP-4-dehydrorhamnose 3,5-epimerase